MGYLNATVATTGPNTFRVEVPGRPEGDIVAQMTRTGAISMFSLQTNLVGYRPYPATPSRLKPIAGTRDVRRLLTLIGRTAPRSKTPGRDTFLFRAGSSGAYAAGPERSRDLLIARLGSPADRSSLAGQFATAPTGFEIVNGAPGFRVLALDGRRPFDHRPRCGAAGPCIAVHDVVAVDNRHIASAAVGSDLIDQPTVQLRFTPEGRKRFLQLTRQVARGARRERPPGGPDQADRFWSFAFVLDGVVLLSPYVSYDSNPAGIDSETAELTGEWDGETARRLATILANGPLPMEMVVTQTRAERATAGAQAIRIGAAAGAAGLGAFGLLAAFVRGPRRRAPGEAT